MTALFILAAIVLILVGIALVQSGHQDDEQGAMAIDREIALKKWPELNPIDRMTKLRDEVYKEMITTRVQGSQYQDICDRYLRLAGEVERIRKVLANAASKQPVAAA